MSIFAVRAILKLVFVVLVWTAAVIECRKEWVRFLTQVCSAHDWHCLIIGLELLSILNIIGLFMFSV